MQVYFKSPTLQRLKLFYKLIAVLQCNTCKFHCCKKDFPRATVTISLPPFVQASLNGFFLVVVALVAQLNLWSGQLQILKEGIAFAGTFSADIFSEEDSTFPTICNWDKKVGQLKHSMGTHETHNCVFALQCFT